MDTRRLLCLVVRHELVVDTTVHDRDAQVVSLQKELLRHLDDAAPGLLLFVARDHHTTAFLPLDSTDAQRLSFGDAAAIERFLMSHNAMNSHKPVHNYFPQQPPRSEGSSALIHVLAHVGPVPPPRTMQPIVRIPQNQGATAKLVASAACTRVDVIQRRRSSTTNGTCTNGPSSSCSSSSPSSLPALVLRCSARRGLLWLSGDHDETRKTTLFVPPVWRLLSAEVFRWLFATSSTTSRGHRVVLTGPPRGGKSAFLGFLLLQLRWLVSPRFVCIVDVPGLTFARVSERGEVLEGTRGLDFRDDLLDPQTIYVFDMSASGVAVQPLRARDVHAKSILVVAYLVAPIKTSRTRTFALPLWTLDDVLVGRCVCQLTLTGVPALFLKWGGIPGRLCTGNVAESGARLEKALRRLTGAKVVQALGILQRTRRWHDVATGYDSDQWRSLVITVGQEHERFTYDGHVEFTSQYVCDRVVAMIKEPTWTIRRRDAPAMPMLWMQIRASLPYLMDEEEAKNETPPPAEAAGMRVSRGRSTW